MIIDFSFYGGRLFFDNGEIGFTLIDKNKFGLNLIRTPHHIIIEISDDGPSIPQELIAQIFDPFVKSCSKNRKEGYGLGLAIAKKDINNHNGIIEAQNLNLGGAIFTITLPLS